jgi:hypothetical protein
MRDDRLILLAETDNVCVARLRLTAGETILLDGGPARVDADVGLGHKIARRAIAAGEKVLKYGAPIGSAMRDIAAGQHVHVHNMQSDYTPTHHLIDAPDRQGETA